MDPHKPALPLKSQPVAKQPDDDDDVPLNLNFLTAIKRANHECVIRPVDASAGKLDQDEMARMVVAGCVFLAALLLIFRPIEGMSRDLTVGAGIPMISTAAAIAIGKGRGK